MEGFKPIEYAAEAGSALLARQLARASADSVLTRPTPEKYPFTNRSDQLPITDDTSKQNGHRRNKQEIKSSHSRRGSALPIALAAAVLVVAGGGYGAYRISETNKAADELVPAGATPIAAGYFATAAKTQNVATMEYSNTGEIQVNYTKADGTVVPVPTEVIGQKLPVSDAGKANISVAWLGSDVALSTKDGKVYVARNEFGLMTNFTATLPNTLRVKLLVNPNISQKDDIGFTKEQADYVKGLLNTSSDGKTYNADAVRSIYVNLTANGSFKECTAPLFSMADNVLAESLKDKGNVVFVGSYKTPEEMYRQQEDVKKILATNALGVTAVTTTCNQPVSSVGVTK